jgi:hypothetical protein
MSVSNVRTSLTALLVEILARSDRGRDARLAAQLAEWRARLGTSGYQDAVAACFRDLSPLDQRRLAVGLGLHDGSGRLAA